MITIEELKKLKESEDKVEFKKGQGGNISYNGGSRINPSERRRCILGYITAICNEKGGYLVIGMTDNYPHQVVGTNQNLGSLGDLEANIYRDTGIRPKVYELFENSKRVLVIVVPSRPIGKIFRFEDVALMRVGEELKPMSDEVYLDILQEQDSDFSKQICKDLSISDLDDDQVLMTMIQYLNKEEKAKMKDFVHLFDGRLSRRQVRTRVERFVEDNMIYQEGEGSSTSYLIGQNYINGIDFISEAIDLAMKKRESKNKSKG